MRLISGVGMVMLAVACGPVVAPPEGTTSSGTGTSTTGDDTRGDASSDPTAAGSVTSGDGSDGPRLDLPPDMGIEPDCADWAIMGCGVPIDRGGVMGSTPLGDFATTRALFGGWLACSVEVCEALPNVAMITLFDASVPIEEIDPWGTTDETLVIDLQSGGFQGPAGQPVQAFLYANRDGLMNTIGQVEVVLDAVPTPEDVAEPFDPRTAMVITGTVAVEEPGWSVAGTFAATYCPDLNQLPVCE